MSRSTRMGLFTSSALVLVIALAALFVGLPSDPDARAASGPPTITVANIAVYAPVSGSRVLVRTAVNAFGNADSSTTIRVRNGTLAGSWSSSQNYGTRTLTFYVSGSAGDLIEVEATNGSDSTLATVGYVPAPSDSAPPNFVVGSITHSGTTTFSVTGTAGPFGTTVSRWTSSSSSTVVWSTRTTTSPETRPRAQSRSAYPARPRAVPAHSFA